MQTIREIGIELENAILALDQNTAEKIIMEANTKYKIGQITDEIISATLVKIGESWESGNLSLSQVYMSGVIFERIIDKILPPKSANHISQPKIAIAVVEDFHLLGKRIIYSSLRASGYELKDLGGGLSIEKIAEIVKKDDIRILLLSVLMLPSALRIKELKKLLLDFDVKIIVGGAPFRFDDKLWMEVGADYYGKDSGDALKIINKIMEEQNEKI